MDSQFKHLPRTPTERKLELARRQAEKQNQASQELATVRACLNQVAATAEGRKVLEYLARLTGAKRASPAVTLGVGLNGQQIVTGVSLEATLYNAARASVWLELRELLDPASLKEMESAL